MGKPPEQKFDTLTEPEPEKDKKRLIEMLELPENASQEEIIEKIIEIERANMFLTQLARRVGGPQNLDHFLKSNDIEPLPDYIEKYRISPPEFKYEVAILITRYKHENDLPMPLK